jgi:hypothetical protein
LRVCPISRLQCKFNRELRIGQPSDLRAEYPPIGQFILLQKVLTFQEVKVIETSFNGSYFVPLGQKTGENARWDLYFSEI